MIERAQSRIHREAALIFSARGVFLAIATLPSIDRMNSRAESPFATPERARTRHAAAVSALIDRPLARAMTQLFEAVHRLEDLKALALRGGAPVHTKSAIQGAEGLSTVDTLADSAGPRPRDELSELQEWINEALLGCDRLGALVGNLQGLLAPPPSMPLRIDVNNAVSRATHIARSLVPAGLAVVERRQRVAAITGWPADIGQALLDAMVQTAHAVRPPGELRVQTAQEGNEIVIFLLASGIGGTPGLALEHVAAIVGAHGGRLDFSTAHPGQAQVRLRLPAAD